MLIWNTIEAGCPICSKRLRLRELGGGFCLGQDSDLLVRMGGKHIIQAEIHTCLHCRFSGFAGDFQSTFRQSLIERFLSELSPQLGGSPPGDLNSTPLPDVQYFWAYRCSAFLGEDDGKIGQRLLRAYWCLRLPPTLSLSPREIANRRKIYLSGAIHHLRLDQHQKSEARFLYLLGELSRRNGDFSSALEYFNRFLGVRVSSPLDPPKGTVTPKGTRSSPGSSPLDPPKGTVTPKGTGTSKTVTPKGTGSSPLDPPKGTGTRTVPKYLRLAAMKLLLAAKKRDSRDRTMEEIIYADSPD